MFTYVVLTFNLLILLIL